MMFWKENRNLETYFWKQKVNYAKDLETRAAKIESKTLNEFVQADWTLNTLSKEWTNCTKNLTIKLEKTDTQSITTLKDKLVHYYVSNQLPTEDAINKQLDELMAGKNAMQNLMLKERNWLKEQRLERIKRQRFENLYSRYDEDHIIVDYI